MGKAGKQLKHTRVLFFLLFSFWLVIPKATAVSDSRMESDPERLDEIISEFWTFLLDESNYGLYVRQKLGLGINTLPDLTFEKAERDVRGVSSLLEKIDRIRSDDISDDQRLTLKILKWELQNMVEAHRYFWLTIPIATDSSPVPDVNRAYTGFRFNEKSRLAEYLKLLNLYPGFISAIGDKLKSQSLHNIVLPREAVPYSLTYLESLVTEPGKSPFFVEAGRLGNISLEQEEIAVFQTKVSETISARINPSLTGLLQYIKSDYIRQAPDTVGLWQYPGGKDYYRYLVKTNTSLDLSPATIHQIGWDMISRLRSELDELRGRMKFQGTVDEFILFLRNDLRFKLKSPEEMGARMTALQAQAKAGLTRFFSKIPQTPCSIKRLDPALENFMTYGYYQVPTAADPTGCYFFNASNFQHKNRLNTASAAMILHELLPGHHFQISLQAENGSLPPFRREYFITAYAEGWAEYASQLGHEMGIYDDPCEHAGRIMQDLFMSVRLVVDTGMNYLQWTRKEAMDLMKKQTLLSDFELETESLRYATGTPAQALAYKMGGLKMWELRHKAEKALGKKFDIRWFHDAVLDCGALPLFLLEKHLNRLIEKKARE